MIAGVDDGYLLLTTGNGQADSTTEFMFGITLALRDQAAASVGRAIRDTTMSGSAIKVLQSVDAVSDDMDWNCSRLLRQEAADGGLDGRPGAARPGAPGRRVMAGTTNLQDPAERALDAMRARGFEQAQVDARRCARRTSSTSRTTSPACCAAPRRSKLSLLGHRRRPQGEHRADRLRRRRRCAQRVAALFDDARVGAAGRRERGLVGPARAHRAGSAGGRRWRCWPTRSRELLDFRARETPKMMLDEALAAHTLVRSHTLTSGGSELARQRRLLRDDACSAPRATATGRARSTTPAAQPTTCAARHATEYFGIGEMMRDTERQIDTAPIGGKFVGDVVLDAAARWTTWSAGCSGRSATCSSSPAARSTATASASAIASPLLTLKSRFDAPGVAALSADALRDAAGRGAAGRRADDADAEPLRQPQDRPAARADGRRRLGDRGRRDAARRSWSSACSAARWSAACRWATRRPTATSPASSRTASRSTDGEVGPALSETMITRQHGADAARRGRGEPRAHRHRRAAAAVAAHREPALLLTVDAAYGGGWRRLSPPVSQMVIFLFLF